MAQWVSDLQADREHTGDDWSPISPTSNLLEVARNETEAETNETGAEPARRRNLPTHNKQAGSTSVDSVEVAEEDEMVTVDLEIESRETTNAESSKDEELTTEGYQVNKSNQAKEVSKSGLETNLHTKPGEYMEPEEVGKIKAEENSENQEGLTAEAAEIKEIPPMEEIKIKEEVEELESKLEIEDTRQDKAQEKELNKVWMQQIIEWPRITETNMDNNDDDNNDDEETVPWSPRPDLINEGTTSGNDTENHLAMD